MLCALWICTENKRVSVHTRDEFFFRIAVSAYSVIIFIMPIRVASVFEERYLVNRYRWNIVVVPGQIKDIPKVNFICIILGNSYFCKGKQNHVDYPSKEKWREGEYFDWARKGMIFTVSEI